MTGFCYKQKAVLYVAVLFHVFIVVVLRAELQANIFLKD